MEQTERSVDFNIFTRGMEVIKKTDPNDTRKRIRCIASSSIEDRHGDTITEACITSMKKQATGLSIFLNHSYALPEDLFGFVEAARTKRMTVAEAKDKGIVPEHTMSGQNPKDIIAFLELDIVLDSNERAARTLESVENGATIGVSIGAMILDYDEKEGHEDSWWPPLIINDVELLEASVVGIPANPLSWVEGATKAVAVSKGLLGKRASREDLDTMIERGVKGEKPSGAKDDDKAETVDPDNVPAGEDMPDAEEEGADEVGEDTSAAADKEVTPEPNPNVAGPAAIVDSYRAALHDEDVEEIERPSIKELRVLVRDELHDFKGVRPSDTEVQRLLDLIVANQPLEAVTKDATTDSPESDDAEPTDAQEATEEGSDPETAEGTDPESKQADVVVQLEAGILKLSGEAKDLLEAALVQLGEEQKRSATLAAENEELQGRLLTADDNVRAAVDFVNTVLDLPSGRKSAVRAEAKKLSSNLRLTYGDEFINILERKGSST